MKNKQGFTMVELLVVLIIVAILAAVATPLYLTNVQRARASEAVGTMGLIRQALRDYNVNHSTYYDVVAATDVGNIQNATPTSVAAGVPTPGTAGLSVDLGTVQYFSNGAFTVESAAAGLSDSDGESNLFTAPPAQDFIIRVTGASGSPAGLYGANRRCASGFTGNCSTKGAEADLYRLEMDNSGRTFVSYNGTSGPWAAY